MFLEKENRRFDRSLSRLFQTALINDGANFPQDLYEKIAQIVKGTPLNAPIDISEYNAVQLINVDYLINKSLLESMLLTNNNPKIYPYQLKICVGHADSVIDIQPKPAHGHIGQFVLKHKQFFYNTETKEDLPYKEIGEFFNLLCKEDIDTERAIGKMMLAFIQKGFHFWENEAYNSEMINLDPSNHEIFLDYTGNYESNDDYVTEFEVCLSDKHVQLALAKDQLESFLVICYLVCVKEVSRRLASPKYYQKNLQLQCKDLPFSVAIYKSLILLADGNIRIGELFASDTQYGVSTGKEITKIGTDHLKKTKLKFNNLNKLFFEKYYKDNKSVKENFNLTFSNSLGLNYNLPEFDDKLIDSKDEWSDDDSEGRCSYTKN